MQDALAEGEVIASHTPKKLQHKSREQLVSIIVKNAFPGSLKLLGSIYDEPVTFKNDLNGTESERNKDPRRLDIILMSTEQREPTLVPYKRAIMERLQQIHSWFKEKEWLGGPKSEIRRQIRNAISERLELIDPFSFIPLYKFILELLFGSKVGGCSDAAQFPFVPRVNCELWKKDCPLFADVLRFFAPFDIEEFSTHHITFGGPQPLLVIIENSPFLKRVYLRNNICEELLMALEKHCPLLNTFHMEKCLGAVMVPINCLYKTFFRGMDYDTVMTFVEKSSPSERHKQLSFSNLKCINFGKMNDLNKKNKSHSLSLFIHTLLYFYSHSINITSETLMPFSPALPEELPVCLRDITYNVLNYSLSGIQRWIASHRSKSEDDIKLPLTSAPQLTFSHTPTDDDETQELVEFSKHWISKLGCKTLFIYTLQDADYHVDISSLYSPLFSQVGSTITSFHFNIVGDIDLLALCDIISMCSNLDLLRIKLTKVHVSSGRKMNIKKLWKLTSVTIHSVEDKAPLVHHFIEKLMEACPELYSLSMVMHDRPCEWLMSLASSKKLADISILRLSFHCFNFSFREMTDFLNEEAVGTPFYVYLIELLSNLKVLQLGSLPHHTFMHLNQIYRKSDLQISIWHVPTDSKEWYGGYREPG